MTQGPLYHAGGRLIMWVPADWCEANAAHLCLIRTRRMRATVHAYLQPDDARLAAWLLRTGWRSGYGCTFVQHLPCGRRMWTLRVVRGSR